MARLILTVEFELDGPGAGWTDVTRDVLVRGGVSWDYGLPGSKPTDTTAQIGEYRLLLDNSPARVVGRYSPGHTNAWAGFDLGMGCRISLSDGTTTRRKLYYLESLQPAHGPDAERRVAVTGTDYLGVALRTQVSDLPLQQNQRSDQILQTIVTALPVAPRRIAFDAGQDTYDYALDDLRGKRSTALEALHRTTLSEQGSLVADADDSDGETLVFFDRLGRSRRAAHAAAAAIPTLAAAAGVRFDRALADVVETVRIGLRLRRVDPAATTVLYRLGDAHAELVPGVTIHPFGPYRDPAQEAQRVGGADMQTPVSGTDYLANSARDGSGADLTSQLTVTASFGGTGVQWTITNPGSQTAYLTRLQARGRGIYDYAQAFLEAGEPAPTQSRSVLNLDLPYQQSFPRSQDIANRLLGIYDQPVTRVSSITLHAARDDETAALAVKLGLHDLVDVIDEATAVRSRYVIHHVAWRISDPDDVRVTWSLTPLSDLDENVCILGRSALGMTTRLSAG